MPLPRDLTTTVAVALARPAGRIPAPNALPGGSRYEPKWDGYRAIVVVDEAGARLYSRRWTDLSRVFPDVVAAVTAQVDPNTVLDGELVIWTGGRLDFQALQHRMSRGPRAAAALGRELPASLVLFDVLATGGKDVRGNALDQRRALLEQIAERWRPPLNLSPVTSDVDVAREWFESYAVAGLEGLVVKGGAQPYPGGTRGWIKVKRRRTIDVVCAAVIGPVSSPQQVVAGLPIDGDLRIVGRTSPLSPAARRALAAWLVPAGDDHPWPETIGAGTLGQWRGGLECLALTRVEPVVVEVSADAAWSGRAFRHALRLVRVRPDVEVSAVFPPEY